MTNTSKFVEFLIDAKKNGYAANGKKEASSRPNSKDYAFQKYDYYYLDSYLGNKDFVGQEVIWQKDHVFWGMNYNGQLLVAEPPAGFSNFLKEALLNVTPEAPFRGPRFFEKNKYTYACSWEGDIFSFKGSETVCFEGKEIFKLYFHGSYIK